MRSVHVSVPLAKHGLSAHDCRPVGTPVGAATGAAVGVVGANVVVGAIVGIAVGTGVGCGTVGAAVVTPTSSAHRGPDHPVEQLHTTPAGTVSTQPLM